MKCSLCLDFRSSKITGIENRGKVTKPPPFKFALEKAARKIEINQRYLKFLEANDYEQLPPDVYTLNILKAYAKILKINPFTVTDIYQKEKALYENSQKKKTDNKPSWQKKIFNTVLNPKFLKIFGILVITLSLLFYLFFELTKIFSAPYLTIFEPTNDLVTNQSQILIKGQTEKEVEVKINERPLLADPQGRFELTNLQKG